MLAPIPIQRIKPTDAALFNERFVKSGQPVVIEQLVDSWPALKRWDTDYFEQHFGTVEVPLHGIENGKIITAEKKGVVHMRQPVAKAVVKIKHNEIASGHVIVAPVTLFGPELQKDYSIPTYCRNKKFLQSIVFISPMGTITSLHQDLPENLYVMVKGKKRITLFAPQAPVYPYPRWSRLPNFSQVDVANPDLTAFPRFKLAQPYTTELKAGEALFIPSFWWHYLHHVEASISISFWWSQGWLLPVAWAADKYRRLRKLGNESSTA